MRQISETARQIRELMYAMTAENAEATMKKASELIKQAPKDKDALGYLEGMLTQASAFGIDIG